jgi:hypothetical protein
VGRELLGGPDAIPADSAFAIAVIASLHETSDLSSDSSMYGGLIQLLRSVSVG